MAPPPPSKGAKASEEVDGKSQRTPISNILFVIAMQTEALPLVTKFKLLEEPFSEFPKGVPWVRYCGKYKGLTINIVCLGKDVSGGKDASGEKSLPERSSQILTEQRRHLSGKCRRKHGGRGAADDDDDDDGGSGGGDGGI